jgi:hypothetical protein
MFKYRSLCFWKKIIMIQTICLILTASFLAWEIDKEKPTPYPLGNGDTLMVRVKGYGFCPNYCKIDHFHFGHYEGYDCEESLCEHITINEE